MEKRIVASQNQVVLVAEGEVKQNLISDIKGFIISTVSAHNLGPSYAVVTSVGFSSYQVPKFIQLEPGKSKVVLDSVSALELHKTIRAGFQSAAAYDKYSAEVESPKSTDPKMMPIRKLVIECLTAHGQQTLQWSFWGSPLAPDPLRLEDATSPLERLPGPQT